MSVHLDTDDLDESEIDTVVERVAADLADHEMRCDGCGSTFEITFENTTETPGCPRSHPHGATPPDLSVSCPFCGRRHDL